MRKHNTTTQQNSSSPEEGQSATYQNYSTGISRKNRKRTDDYIEFSPIYDQTEIMGELYVMLLRYFSKDIARQMAKEIREEVWR